MDKFSCTRALGEEIYYATLIAENEQQARERCLSPTHNRGAEAAHTALEMARVMQGF